MRPVTTPELLIVATEVLELLQVPPVAVFVKVVDVPVQMLDAPEVVPNPDNTTTVRNTTPVKPQLLVYE